MSEAGEQEVLWQGVLAHVNAGRIGGGGSYVDDQGRATVTLAVVPNGAEGEDLDLRQGDTFELGDEVWEVTQIRHADADDWGATLTRVS